MKFKQFLKKLDERFSRIENIYWHNIYMFFRHFFVTAFKRLFRTVPMFTSDNTRVIRTLDELDKMLAKLDAAQSVSDDELRKLFPTFRMEFESQIPIDPYADEYAKVQFDLYHKIAGKNYSVENEKSKFDLDAAVVRPFPYSTGSCETVGNHLNAIAHAIRSMNLKPGAKIVEFGPGWGNITIFLAMMGFDVTAVDIEKNFCDLLERRAQQAGVKIRVVNADFSWIEQFPEPVDAILYFECFHHGSDHLRVIKALDKAVKDDGRVYFASEPITQTFPIPWGVRLDGESLWAIRKHGWLELGFSEQYFLQTLKKFGWDVQKHSLDSLPWAAVYEAAKRRFPKRFSVSDPMIFTQVGSKNSNCLSTSNSRAGYLIYGPYVSLPSGRYTAALFSCDSNDAEGKGRMEIACKRGEVVLAISEIDFNQFKENEQIQIEFKTEKTELDIEVRLYCYSNSSIKIRAIEIEDTMEL